MTRSGRSVFRLTAAYLGRIESETRCAFWPTDPTQHRFAPDRLISVDLANTPSAAASGTIPWSGVEVDDCQLGPRGELVGSTLGPRWPEIQIIGALYLAETFLERLPDVQRPPWPPDATAGRAYEHQAATYWPETDDPRAGSRYTGHHARIIDERGSLARLIVFPPGASRSGREGAPLWVDLDAPDQCDAGPGQLTQLRTGPSGPKEGAVFLISGRLEPEGE